MEPRTLQHVASRYTDWAIAVPFSFAIKVAAEASAPSMPPEVLFTPPITR
jgi:hypothetical protein